MARVGFIAVDGPRRSSLQPTGFVWPSHYSRDPIRHNSCPPGYASLCSLRLLNRLKKSIAYFAMGVSEIFSYDSPLLRNSPLIYRYLRLVVNLFAFCRHRPVPLPEAPLLTCQDVTVVIPSLQGDGGELWDTIQSILATEPHEIILVTVEAHELRARMMVKSMGTSKVRICSVAQANKRRQMVCAIPEVRTEITIFADDDVTWPKTLLPWMLAPLEDERYGGVGTNQRLRRAECPNLQQRMWGYLGALYLERRNFDCASCMYMDGGLPCLSGRTVAYRTRILRDPAFTYSFTHEEWLGQYRMYADDDNFITRWLVSHGQKIAYQYHKQSEVQTTLEDNPKFLRQCLRWSRSNWRSNITSMFCDGQIWTSVGSSVTRSPR
ncbi:MAG: hypothetical protein Q9190_000614 [Brigantiaea leucoxantha]